ncbi:MAG: hypothetical protein WC747_00985 [Candidatus Babeliales bacterium]|jgi:hypothetical protein
MMQNLKFKNTLLTLLLSFSLGAIAQDQENRSSQDDENATRGCCDNNSVCYSSGTFCSLIVKGALSAKSGTFGRLNVSGNETVGGNLNVGGNLMVGGTITDSNGNTLGATGATGATGGVGSGGVAEFTQFAQGVNVSRAPGDAFLIGTQVSNTTSGAVTSTLRGDGGTYFTLTAGTYIFDYEMSLGSAGSVAIYTGATEATVVIDDNSVAGSTTATTWIHGRSIVTVPPSTTVAAIISPLVGTFAVVTAGTATGYYMVRLTILKVA